MVRTCTSHFHDLLNLIDITKGMTLELFPIHRYKIYAPHEFISIIRVTTFSLPKVKMKEDAQVKNSLHHKHRNITMGREAVVLAPSTSHLTQQIILSVKSTILAKTSTSSR